MSRASKEQSFYLTKELADRLRSLRKRVGLSQTELSRLMGGGRRCFQQHISRLESGKHASPSLRLIADYLRACRASFDDIRDILNQYTEQPTVAEHEARKAVQDLVAALPPKVATKVNAYDAKISVRRRLEGKLPEPVDERLEKNRKLAQEWILLQALEDRLQQALNHIGARHGGPVRKGLADFGRKVWGILKKTRGRKPEKREELLAEAREWLVKEDVVSEEAVGFIEGITKELFEELELRGDLDRLPGRRHPTVISGASSTNCRLKRFDNARPYTRRE